VCRAAAVTPPTMAHMKRGLRDVCVGCVNSMFVDTEAFCMLCDIWPVCALCVCVCMCVCVCVHVYVHACVYVQDCFSVCVRLCVYVHIQTCKQICVWSL